ncbi:MAG: DUF3604 domain-containing protein [Armatimonadia bacterium]|nr:DUF3604 domain-containing protein [Armatimonadia bacterium]
MPDGRSFTHPSRDAEYSAIVYGGPDASIPDLARYMQDQRPEPHGYRVLWGEIHGHSEVSDGRGTPDDYYRAARDDAGLDFCALTDHDHGGVGRTELWGEKWDLIQSKVAEYHDPGRFVTLLGYERDSSPWYSNLCLYYREGEGDMVRGERDGHITRDELADLLARDDILSIPHHTTTLNQGVNFEAIPPELWTPLIEVYSKWGTSEYFGNPRPTTHESPFGHWRDALVLGARMGCVAGSDVHSPHPGMDHHAGGNLRYDEPGLVALLAEDLTREAIFEALRSRRCYAATGARILIDLRVAGVVMGQETQVARGEARPIRLTIQGGAPLQTVATVKNGRDYFVAHLDGSTDSYELIVDDYKPERATDYYYVRVTRCDGRQAWSSPIWVAAG